MKLRVNAAKSAVARPWERKFLGLQRDRAARGASADRQAERATTDAASPREAASGRGRSLRHTIETLNPLLRGWINYFRLTESKTALEELDGWMRRRAALPAVAAVEAADDPRAQAACARARRGCVLGDQQRQRSWSVVERRSVSHAPGFPTACFTRLGLVSLLARVAATSACSLNRRMRNRTSGGVGGRRG